MPATIPLQAVSGKQFHRTVRSYEVRARSADRNSMCVQGKTEILVIGIEFAKTKRFEGKQMRVTGKLDMNTNLIHVESIKEAS